MKEPDELAYDVHEILESKMMERDITFKDIMVSIRKALNINFPKGQEVILNKGEYKGRNAVTDHVIFDEEKGPLVLLKIRNLKDPSEFIWNNHVDTRRYWRLEDFDLVEETS